MKTGAVITAAGKSTRMGSFKPLLKIGNFTAAEHVIRNFHAAGIRDIVFVTGNKAEELENSLEHLDILFLRNERYEHNEMFDSVKIGLNYLKDTCGRVFLSPVDVPLFGSDTVKLLLNSKANAGIPVYKEKTGHPIILDSDAVKKILAYQGSGGLRDAIADISLEIEYIETGDQGILLDMDTPADYEKLVQLYDRKNSRESKLVYLVRHGECEFPKENESYCIGLTDLNLSEKGRRQAEDLEAYFADKNIKAVYHSYLLRAKQTAAIISNGKYPVIQEDGLEEIDMGEWDGLSFREIRAQYPRIYEKRGKSIIRVVPPGAESFLKGLARFSAALKRIIPKEEENIVIVSHAGVNRIFLCETLGLNYNKVLSIAQPNGCINTVKVKNGCFSVDTYGKMPLDTHT